MKALQTGTEPANNVVPPGPVAVLEGQIRGQGTSVLEAMVRICTLLPAGWRAEVGPGSVVLTWRTDPSGAMLKRLVH
jgi:hypothetical protein